MVFLILCWQSIFASEWEYWNKTSITGKLTDRIDLRIEPNFRFNGPFPHFYYSKIFIGPIFGVSKLLKLSPSYAYKASEKNNQWKKENMGVLDIELKLSFLFDSFLHYRLRTEYSFTNDECVLRNRFRLLKDYKKIKGLSFLIWDEIFYNFVSEEINENQTGIGFSKKISKNLALGLSYILRYKKSNDWCSWNLIETELRINF